MLGLFKAAVHPTCQILIYNPTAVAVLLKIRFLHNNTSFVDSNAACALSYRPPEGSCNPWADFCLLTPANAQMMSWFPAWTCLIPLLFSKTLGTVGLVAFHNIQYVLCWSNIWNNYCTIKKKLFLWKKSLMLTNAFLIFWLKIVLHLLLYIINSYKSECYMNNIISIYTFINTILYLDKTR